MVTADTWSKISTFALVLLLLGTNFVWTSSKAQVLDIRVTPWEEIARAQDIDPFLIYAVALEESRRRVASNWVTPWPWALGIDTGSIYAKSKLEALEAFYQAVHQGKCVDVGIMQISTCWHAGRVAHLHDLLDPLINIRVGAKILREALDSAPNDPELAVGRYHNWSSETRARSYGRRVLGTRANLLRLAAGRGGWLSERCCQYGSLDRGAQ